VLELADGLDATRAKARRRLLPTSSCARRVRPRWTHRIAIDTDHWELSRRTFVGVKGRADELRRDRQGDQPSARPSSCRLCCSTSSHAKTKRTKTGYTTDRALQALFVETAHPFLSACCATGSTRLKMTSTDCQSGPRRAHPQTFNQMIAGRGAFHRPKTCRTSRSHGGGRGSARPSSSGGYESLDDGRYSQMRCAS